MQVMFLSPQEKDIFGPLLQLAGPGTPEQVATPKTDGGPKRRGSPPGSGSRQWPKWPRKGKGGKGKEKGRESERGSEEAEGNLIRVIAQLLLRHPYPFCEQTRACCSS